tara:strand:- start:1130 stop:1726 length:597 start_codon:yes stop_codon:yes gene_type:complete
MGFKSDIEATNVALSMTGRDATGYLETTLDGALTAASTSVVVDDITGFPTTADGGGVIEVGTELIKYTTLTAGTKTFSGLTRNYNQQTNDAGLNHNDGIDVIGYNIIVGGTTSGIPLRLKALSVASSGAGTGDIVLVSGSTYTVLSLDIPSGAIFTLNIPEAGILCSRGILIQAALNITGITAFTDKFSGPNLTTTNG